jgi:hypothetical protein
MEKDLKALQEDFYRPPCNRWQATRPPTIGLHMEYLALAKSDQPLANACVRKLGRFVSRADKDVTGDGAFIALGRGGLSAMEPPK